MPVLDKVAAAFRPAPAPAAAVPDVVPAEHTHCLRQKNFLGPCWCVGFLIRTAIPSNDPTQRLITPKLVAAYPSAIFRNFCGSPIGNSISFFSFRRRTIAARFA